MSQEFVLMQPEQRLVLEHYLRGVDPIVTHRALKRAVSYEVFLRWEKAAFGNKKERASDYGRTNTQEAFAESFAQMHHTPREAWAPSTHKLHALMEHFNNNHPDHKDSWHSL